MADAEQCRQGRQQIVVDIAHDLANCGGRINEVWQGVAGMAKDVNSRPTEEYWDMARPAETSDIRLHVNCCNAKWLKYKNGHRCWHYTIYVILIRRIKIY